MLLSQLSVSYPLNVLYTEYNYRLFNTSTVAMERKARKDIITIFTHVLFWP